MPVPEVSLATPRLPRLQKDPRRERAKGSANRLIGFIGHVLVFLPGCLLVFVTGGFLPGLIVTIGWLIAVLLHGFFGVLAPVLRDRWLRRDLSQHRAEAEAGRAQAEARHARSVAELSAAIAHEIRNPITAARSLVQQIAEDPAAPENREYATVAVEELDRVERSISHLLKFAREEPRRLGKVSLAETVNAAVELLRERLDRARVTVACDTAEAATVDGDAEQLRRVLGNLVGNAIDALADAKTPSPRIEIHAGQNLARTEAWLSVTDNGPGIPPEALPKIFTPFYTSKTSGTGLGLALTKKIVEEHGGTIEAKSPPGRGAELLVTLPVAAAERPS
jgi:signal transduction histidine kinase